MNRNNISNTYFIGRVTCVQNNALMKEVAEYLKDYQNTIVRGDIQVFFDSFKRWHDGACERHKRCQRLELKLCTETDNPIISADKPGTDHPLLVIVMFNAFREIEIQ